MKNQILKRSLKVIFITACTCLFHIEILKAQITYREVNKQNTSSKITNSIVPYDSISLRIIDLEKRNDFYNKEEIEYYKKYIGQQFYLLRNTIKDSYSKSFIPKTILFTEKETTNKKPKTKTNTYCPICNEMMDLSIQCFNDKSKVENKYYDIINVDTYNSGLRLRFILKETVSGDIVYTFNPESFIIVGAVVKAKQISVGKTFLEIEWERNEELSKDFPKLKNKWECKDVTFVDTLGHCSLVYVLQNTNDTSKEDFQEYPLKLKSYNELRENYNIFRDKWVSEDTYNRYINYKDSLLRDREEKILLVKKEEERQHLLDEQKKEEEKKNAEEEKRLEEEYKKQQELKSAEYNKQREKEKAQRKQMLINKYGQTNGLRVFNQEPEIGMTKAMFDDMNLKPWVISNQKMETENGIAEVFVIRIGLYKCKRIVIINQKIKQVDTYNCN